MVPGLGRLGISIVVECLVKGFIKTGYPQVHERERGR